MFWLQILATMLLLLCICAITDKRNTQVPSSLVPMYVGFLIIAIGVCFGANCGYALNPARDLAPRILTLIAGWGTQVFRYIHWLAVSLMARWRLIAHTSCAVTNTTPGFGSQLLDPILEPFSALLSTCYLLKFTGPLKLMKPWRLMSSWPPPRNERKNIREPIIWNKLIYFFQYNFYFLFNWKILYIFFET